MGKREKIIYSITVEDVQNVAQEELERKLNKDELRLVEDKLGDHIDWYEAILYSINLAQIKSRPIN